MSDVKNEIELWFLSKGLLRTNNRDTSYDTHSKLKRVN